MSQTLDQIREILTAKNIRFETVTPLTEWDDFQIGIMLQPWCWTWFRIDDECGLCFKHTYSQNTGSSKKGFSHRCKKYAHLSKLGIKNLYEN